MDYTTLAMLVKFEYALDERVWWYYDNLTELMMKHSTKGEWDIINAFCDLHEAQMNADKDHWWNIYRTIICLLVAYWVPTNLVFSDN